MSGVIFAQPNGAASISLHAPVRVDVIIPPESMTFPRSVAQAVALNQALSKLDSAATSDAAVPRAGLSRFMPPWWGTGSALAASAIAAMAVDRPYGAVPLVIMTALALIQCRDTLARYRKLPNEPIAPNALAKLKAEYTKAMAEAGTDIPQRAVVQETMAEHLKGLREHLSFDAGANAFFYEVLTDAPQLTPEQELVVARAFASAKTIEAMAAAEKSGKPTSKVSAQDLRCADPGEVLGLEIVLGQKNTVGYRMAHELHRLGDDARSVMRARLRERAEAARAEAPPQQLSDFGLERAS